VDHQRPGAAVALAALTDHAWQAHTREQLQANGERLCALLAAHGIQSNGTPLFQWWAEAQPEAFWQHMAERGIWVRLFTQAARGIRLGLPPDEAGWQRLNAALTEWSKK
jgi:cobalamin biosynthetic protein CobC